MWDNLFSSVDLLQKGFDAANTRYKVIANNIANVDTPGFKASEVQFEDLMADSLGTSGGTGTGLALTTTDEGHVASVASGSGSLGLTATNAQHYGSASTSSDVEPKVVTEDTSLRYDENNVDIESEMVELSKNTINYYALTAKVNSEFAKLKTAIDA
jgi:flagellar basal-body rod protein FlgB